MELSHVMSCIRRCVMTQFRGSLAYLYTEELRQADVPYPSGDALRSRFMNFISDKTAARDINSDPERLVSRGHTTRNTETNIKNQNRRQTSSDGSSVR